MGRRAGQGEEKKKGRDGEIGRRDKGGRGE